MILSQKMKLISNNRKICCYKLLEPIYYKLQNILSPKKSPVLYNSVTLNLFINIAFGIKSFISRVF